VGEPTERREDWLEPHPTRLSHGHAQFDEISQRHIAAVEANIPTYIDPVSGFSVFTARFLARRGYCCASGCRHCPFEL